MSTPAPEDRSESIDEIDLLEYLRVLYRRKWLVVAVALTVFVAGAVFTLGRTKIYAGRASLIIDPAAPKYLDDQVGEVTEPGSSYLLSKEYYATQHKVIRSAKVAQRVVDKLGLRNDLGFLGADQIKDEAKRAAFLAKADPVKVLQDRLKVDSQKDSRVVDIVIEDRDPVRAALLSNELADAYIAENLAERQSTSHKASEWLEERIGGLESQSRESELALYNFKKQADMLSTALEDRANMVSQRLTKVNADLTDVKLRIAELRARVDTINALRKKFDAEDPSWADALPTTEAQRDLIRELKVTHLKAMSECAELRERYLEHHPGLLACEEKLRVATEALSHELKSIITRHETELAEAVKQERNLEELLGETKVQAHEVNARQADYERLKRTADDDLNMYQLVLKRLKELELSGALNVSNARVLDRAKPSELPVRPNVPVSMALSLLLGLAAGVVAAFGREWLDDSVTSQEDVEGRLGVPFLGLVPSLPQGGPNLGDLHVHHSPRSQIAESTRAIRTNLLFMSPEKPFRTIVVTSSAPQEGKSTNVINLGIAMAQSGSRVLLVDTDMRRPRLHKAFGVSNEIGVSSLIVGERERDAAIKSTEVPGLFVLPCGPIPPNPSELLHTQAFKSLLEELGGRFDRIILDSPPVGAVTDALVLAAQADGVMLVVRAAKTRRELAKRAVHTLHAVNARLFGAVLNDVDLKQGGYGYGGYYGAYREREEAA